MTEAELRDLIAIDVTVLETGLTLLQKEQYIPNALGTRGFIDLYAKDAQGHHVLIELKKSDAAAREAIHEIHKYVEGVKGHFGARDNEIRVIVASIEWRELLVPLSRLVAETNLAILSLQLYIDEDGHSVRSSPVSMLNITQGRFIAPWHDVNWYLNNESLERGIASIEACCKEKGIEDYVIVVLQPPQPVHSEHQADMWASLKMMVEAMGQGTNTTPKLPLYEYIAYVAMQALTIDRYLGMVQRDGQKIEETRETIQDMEEEEALQFLHETVLALDPRSLQDHLEIGYPAKFTKFIDAYGCRIESVLRYGTFSRNVVLDDESIVSELRGEDGLTGQRFKRTLRVSNRSHMAAARLDIANCLDQNHAWKSYILRALDEIEREFQDAEVDISIFNPATGILTLYYSTTRDDGFLYVPTYSLIVRNPESVRMYYGGLQGISSPLSFREIIDKYYEGDLFGLLFTMSWGGHEDRDADIVEDLGLVYRTFRCDIVDGVRSFFLLRDERWRSCEAVDILSLFDEYIEENRDFVSQVVEEIASRMIGGVVDASFTRRLLGE